MPLYIDNGVSLNSVIMRNVPEASHRENQSKLFIFNSVFRKSCPSWGKAATYGSARQATIDNTIGRRRDALCMLGN